MNLSERVNQLRSKIIDIESRPYLKKLRQQNKMHVRERLDYMLDEGSFVEDGVFARCLEEKLPTDAIVTGIGKIKGRPICIMANDMTVKAGSWGSKTIEKIIRIQEKALELKIPILYLIDSAGARLDEQFDIFIDRRHAGMIFRLQGVMSGVVPQISAVFGPSPAGSAYIPALSDVVIMVDKNTSVYLGSPRMAEMVIGERVTMEEMGGARMHCETSGLGDYLAKDDQEALDIVMKYLQYMPQNWQGTILQQESREPKEGRPIEEIIPENQRIAYNVKELIERVADGGSFFEFKKLFGRELITGFARLGGRTIGLLANQSNCRGGVLFPDTAEKGSHFIGLCNAFGIPLLFLMDISGFMIGRKVESEAIIRKGARWLNTIFNCTVPRISVIVRKAYGAGYVAMSGASCMPDACIALPTAYPGIMGPEAAVNAIYFNKIQEIQDKNEKAKYIEEKHLEYQENINALKAADKFFIDDIVVGSHLREELIKRFAYYCEDRKIKQNMEQKRNIVIR